jgi:hypothetical protein
MATPRDWEHWFVYLLHSLFAALVVAGILFLVFHHSNKEDPPYMRYYISIDSASGLDLPPSKDLALDPQFNLTLRLASSDPSCRPVCVYPGTYVLVSHRCVPLATSAAATHELCVGGPGNSSSVTVPVVARGTGVRLPGYMMDGLVADLRSGVADFEVRLRRPNFVEDRASWAVMRVGDVAAESSPERVCPESQDKDKTTTTELPLIY